MTLRSILALSSLLALGCARDLDAGEREGRACDADAECNARAADAACGWLRLCIAGRCEVATDAGGSQLVICDE